MDRVPSVRYFPGGYDGDDPLRVLEFAEEVRTAWHVVGEDSARRRRLVLENVGPIVKLELSCRDHIAQETPEQLLDLIVQSFGETRSPLQLLQVVLEQRQSTGKVLDFSHRLKHHFDNLIRRQVQLKQKPMEAYWVRDMFIQGLRDVELRRHLRLMVVGNPDITFFVIREAALFYLDQDDVPLGKLAADPVPSPGPMFENVACSSVLIPPVSSQILASDSVPQSRPSGADPHRVAVPQQRADHIPALMSLSPRLIPHLLLDGQLPHWIRPGRRTGSGRCGHRNTPSVSPSIDPIKTLFDEMKQILKTWQASRVPTPVEASCVSTPVEASRVPPPVEEKDCVYLEHFVVESSAPQPEPQVEQPTCTLPVPVVTVPSPDPVPIRRSSRQIQQIQALKSEGSVATMTVAPPV